MSVKLERIGNSILKEISEIIRFEAKDKDLKNVTITFVKVTGDLGLAKVYYNILNKEDLPKIQKSLDAASGYIRKELAQRIDLRHVPQLKFLYDETIEQEEKIEQILEEIKN